MVIERDAPLDGLKSLMFDVSEYFKYGKALWYLKN